MKNAPAPQTAPANLDHLGAHTPLAKVLQSVAEARHAARGRMIGGLLKGQPGKALEARAEGQRAVVIARRRALAAAQATVTAEQDRLFAANVPYARQNPAVEYAREQRISQAIADLNSDADATEAIGRALQERNSADGWVVAGGIAQHALQQGWDGALTLWCQPMVGGGSRGGWDTVRSIRAARALQVDLAAGRWPTVLQDLPTVEALAAERRPGASA